MALRFQFESPEQKRYFFVSVVLVVILLGITILQASSLDFSFKNKVTGDKKTLAEQAALDDEAYQRYVAQLENDKVAQRNMWLSLSNEQNVYTQMQENLLSTDNIAYPEISPKDLKVSKNDNSKEAAEKYFGNLNDLANKLTYANASLLDSLTPVKNNVALAQSQKASEDVYTAFKKTVVPKDAVEIHKSALVIVEQSRSLFNAVKDDDLEDITRPWVKEAFKAQYISNLALAKVQLAYNDLDHKYAFTNHDPDFGKKLSAASQTAVKLGLADKAEALFPVTVTFNPYDLLKEIARDLIATFVAKYMQGLIDKIHASIQKLFQITSFLAYTDSLSAYKYQPQYLDKFIPGNNLGSDVTKGIISGFTRQFSCSGSLSKDVQTIIKSQAKQQLGFDPNTFDPKDGSVLVKAAKAADFFSNPEFVKLNYQLIGKDVDNYSDKAATTEQLASSSFKSATASPVKGSTNTPATGTGSQTTVSSGNADVDKALNEGKSWGLDIIVPTDDVKNTFAGLKNFASSLSSSNPRNLIAKFAVAFFTTLINKSLFKGYVLANADKCGNKSQISGANRDGNISILKAVRSLEGVVYIDPNEGDPNQLSGYLATSANSIFSAETAVKPLGTVEYQITIANVSDHVVENIHFTDSLPQGNIIYGDLKIDGQRTAVHSIPDWARGWDVRSLDPGESVTFTYTADMGAGTRPGETYLNSASIDKLVSVATVKIK